MKSERTRKERERERRMSGPIVFPPHSELTTGRAYSAVTPPLSSPIPLLFLPLPSPKKKKSFSEPSFIIDGSSLNFPPFFLIIGFTSSVQSRTVAGILSLPSVHLRSLQTPFTPTSLLLHPHFFSFVRHHIRIYKSQLTAAHSPPQKKKKLSSKLLPALLCNFLVVCNVWGQA